MSLLKLSFDLTLLKEQNMYEISKNKGKNVIGGKKSKSQLQTEASLIRDNARYALAHKIISPKDFKEQMKRADQVEKGGFSTGFGGDIDEIINGELPI